MAKSDFPDVLDFVRRVKRPDLAHSHCFEVDPVPFYEQMTPTVEAVAAGADPPELSDGMPTLRVIAQAAVASKNEGEMQHACHLFLDYALHHRYPEAEGVAIRILAPNRPDERK